MITSVTIENFKRFKHLEIPELARITLLGGRNNVGKTSVLEALALFFGRVGPRMFFRHLARRGISSISSDAEIVVTPLFREYQSGNKITISVSEGDNEETMEIEFHYSYLHKAIEIQMLEKDEKNSQAGLGEETNQPYIVDITYKSKGKNARKAQVISESGISEVRGDNSLFHPRAVALIDARTTFNSDMDAVRFGQLDIVGKQSMVVELLQILEPRIQSLSTVAVGQKFLIHADIGIGRKIPIAFMGEGINRLLSIVLTIATTKDGLVLIDEVENGIHQSGMAKIWEGISRACKEFNCQIVATTHSYDCILAAYEGSSHAGLSDEFKYVRLDRTPEDIIAKTYSHAMVGAAIERGWEVR